MMEQQLIRPDLRMASKSANLELNEKVFSLVFSLLELLELIFLFLG